MSIFKKYLAYIQDNPEKYWFKRKLFGWGWTPATWQGWLVTILYIVAVVAFALTVDAGSPPREVVFTFFLPLLFLTILLFRILYRKGEKPRWSWGFPKKK